MLKSRISLLVPGGAAKPGPKMGQALGPLGINMVQFCKVPN
jgi:large subunit ribosomal protein L11